MRPYGERLAISSDACYLIVCRPVRTRGCSLHLHDLRHIEAVLAFVLQFIFKLKHRHFARYLVEKSQTVGFDRLGFQSLHKPIEQLSYVNALGREVFGDSAFLKLGFSPSEIDDQGIWWFPRFTVEIRAIQRTALPRAIAATAATSTSCSDTRYAVSYGMNSPGRARFQPTSP